MEYINVKNLLILTLRATGKYDEADKEKNELNSLIRKNLRLTDRINDDVLRNVGFSEEDIENMNFLSPKRVSNNKKIEEEVKTNNEVNNLKMEDIKEESINQHIESKENKEENKDKKSIKDKIKSFLKVILVGGMAMTSTIGSAEASDQQKHEQVNPQEKIVDARQEFNANVQVQQSDIASKEEVWEALKEAKRTGATITDQRIIRGLQKMRQDAARARAQQQQAQRNNGGDGR